VIESGHFTLGKMELPALRELELRTCGLTRANLKSVISVARPRLERLHLWFGSDRYGAQCGVADLGPILDGSGFPALRHLGLMNAEFNAELCAALPKARVLARLSSLDLSMGTLTDEDADVLIAHGAAFRHLERLNLARNHLSKAATKRVKGLAKIVDTDRQKELDTSIPGEVYRYVSVSE